MTVVRKRLAAWWDGTIEKSREINTGAFLLLVLAGALLLVVVPTGATAIIGAIAALIIAFVAYPWQKSKDRDLKVAEEKRISYQRFFDAAEIFFARTAAFDHNTKLPDEEFGRLEAAKAELAFRAGQGGVRACAAFAQCLKDYRRMVKLCTKPSASPATRLARDEAYKAANLARIEALCAARKDAGIQVDDSASEDCIRKLFMMKVSEEQAQ